MDHLPAEICWTHRMGKMACKYWPYYTKHVFIVNDRYWDSQMYDFSPFIFCLSFCLLCTDHNGQRSWSVRATGWCRRPTGNSLTSRTACNPLEHKTVCSSGCRRWNLVREQGVETHWAFLRNGSNTRFAIKVQKRLLREHRNETPSMTLTQNCQCGRGWQSLGNNRYKRGRLRNGDSESWHLQNPHWLDQRWNQDWWLSLISLISPSFFYPVLQVMQEPQLSGD